MAPGLVLFAAHDVQGEPEFSVRCHPAPVAVPPFVVLTLGNRDMTLNVSEPAHLIALGKAVADAHDLLTAALTGQDPLPVEPTAVLA